MDPLGLVWSNQPLHVSVSVNVRPEPSGVHKCVHVGCVTMCYKGYGSSTRKLLFVCTASNLLICISGHVSFAPEG